MWSGAGHMLNSATRLDRKGACYRGEVQVLTTHSDALFMPHSILMCISWIEGSSTWACQISVTALDSLCSRVFLSNTSHLLSTLVIQTMQQQQELACLSFSSLDPTHEIDSLKQHFKSVCNSGRAIDHQA